MLWYSNIAVGESGALQELQKFLKKYSNIAVGESGALQELQKFLKKQIFKKMKKVLDKSEKM